jgi:hypothetical protein
MVYHIFFIIEIHLYTVTKSKRICLNQICMENLNCQLCPLTVVLLTQTKNQKYCKPTLLPIPELPGENYSGSSLFDFEHTW